MSKNEVEKYKKDLDDLLNIFAKLSDEEIEESDKEAVSHAIFQLKTIRISLDYSPCDGVRMVKEFYKQYCRLINKYDESELPNNGIKSPILLPSSVDYLNNTPPNIIINNGVEDISFIQSLGNNYKRKLELIKKYKNDETKEKVFNELLKKDIETVVKEITELKPSSYTLLQKYLRIEDLDENIYNLDKLIYMKELCNKKFVVNESVTMLDEDKEGKIIEILKDNKYKIETGDGETFIKSKECLMSIEIDSTPLMNEDENLPIEAENSDDNKPVLTPPTQVDENGLNNHQQPKITPPVTYNSLQSGTNVNQPPNNGLNNQLPINPNQLQSQVVFLIPNSPQYNYYISSLPLIKADIHNIQLILNCITDLGMKKKIPELYNTINSLPNQNPTNQNYEVFMKCVDYMNEIIGLIKTLLQYYMDVVGKFNKFSTQQYLTLLNQNPIRVYDYCVAIKALYYMKEKCGNNR